MAGIRWDINTHGKTQATLAGATEIRVVDDPSGAINSKKSTLTALAAFVKSVLGLVSSDISDFTEAAQDATGAMAANSARVSLAYVDGTPSLTADLVSNSITAGYLHSAAAHTLFGNSTGAAGAGEDITLGAGLAFVGTTLASTITQYTDEMAQDAVGGILTDTAEIDFTYNDGANTITADLKNNSVGLGRLVNATQRAMVAASTAGAWIETALSANVFTMLGSADNAAIRSNVGAVNIAGDTMTGALAINASVSNVLSLTSSVNATTGVQLASYHNRAVPAVNDLIFYWNILGNNTTPAQVAYGSYRLFATNVTPGAEAGLMDFQTALAGATGSRLRVGAGVFHSSATGGDKGNNTLNFGTIYQNNVQVAVLGANTFPSVQQITVASGNALQLQCDDAGANGVTIQGFHNSASPAASDSIFNITAIARNSTPANVTYAAINCLLLDPTAASEDAAWRFQTQVAGAIGERIRIAGGVFHPSATGADKGNNTINFSTIYQDNHQVATRDENNNFSTQQTIKPGTAVTPLQLTSNNPVTIVNFDTYRTGIGGPTNYFRKARGTDTSPTVVVQGDVIYDMIGWGYDGAAFQQTSIDRTIISTATPSATDMQGQRLFYVSGPGSVSPTEVFRLEANNGLQAMGTNIFLDANRIFRPRSYTIATLPTATATGVISCSDLGGGVSNLVSNGASGQWMRVTAGYETAGDASSTIDILTNSAYINQSTTLTADRALTMSNTRAYKGAAFQIQRSSGGAFKLDLKQSGGTVIFTFPSGVTGRAIFVHDGTDWQLWAYQTIGRGTLGDASVTIAIYDSPDYLDQSTTLTADRAVTLSNTGAVKGARKSIRRSSTGAFKLDIKQSGGTVILTIPSGAKGTAEFVHDGTDWQLFNTQTMWGTYQPTLTNTTNVAASTNGICLFQRVGDMVTVSGQVSVDPTTANTLTQLGISLPIASNLAAVTDLAGTIGGPAVTATASQGGFFQADTTNDRAVANFSPVNVTNQTYGFTFMYQVL